MKLRSATPASISLLGKSLIVLAVVVMAFVAPLQYVQRASADQYDDRINGLNQDIAKYQAETERLSSQAQSLESVLSTLANEKATIQAQIAISQAKYDQLVVDIANTEKRIKDNQDALGTTIANLYVDQKISPLEMIASSKNISDYLDKQEYRNSVRDELTNTIKVVKDLKVKLDSQKVEVDRVLKDQKAQESSLVAKETEQQNLLNETQSNANAYQQLVGQRASEIAQLREAQRIAFAALNSGSSSSPTGYPITFKNWSGNSSCGGGYHYCNYALDAYVSDDWGLHLAGECVHYTAWALENRGYYIPFNAFSTSNGYGGGNANRWVPVATGMGFATLVGNPQPDDLAYMAIGGVGHVGIVEQNYGNGWVKISQYNFDVHGDDSMYSTMDLKITGNTQFLRFGR